MKKSLWFVFLVFSVSCSSTQSSTSAQSSATAHRSIKVYFSDFTQDVPGQAMEDTIVSEIKAAQKQILVQAFDINSDAICKALRKMYTKHVRVKVLVDKRYMGEDCVTKFENRGIPTRPDDDPAFAHNKIIIIDSSIVITGSYNFTEHAKQNVENLLVIDDPLLVQQYSENWWSRWNESK